VAAPYGDGTRYCILLRKNKVGEEVRWHLLPLQAKTMFAIDQWIKSANMSESPIPCAIDCGENIGGTLGSGQLNHIYKRLARQAG
jgi:hypothetical protein